MLLTQGSISEEEKSVLAKVGEYPAIQTLDDEIHTLYGEKTYVLPKLDGVNLRIVHLNQNRYALLTRQGYVADEFIKPINQLLPQKIFELADKYTVVLELESILIPTTSKSLCNYNVIDLFDEKRVAMIPLAERNKLCKQYDLNYPEVISTVTLNAQNGKNTKRATMALILKQSLEGLIFETESKGMSYKLRYKNNKYESKIAKTEQEYSKLFLEMGYAFLEFESVCPKIKSRLTREFGVQPSIEFIKNTHTEYSKKIVSGATCLVDHYSNNFKSFPLSILIGGNNGTGKTMIARKLANMFEIDHRLGTGFIREIAKFYCPKTPELFYHTWELADRLNTSPYEGFKIQADLLNVPINSLIKRANEEGTSIIIEGNHLIPEIMTRTKATTCLVLNVSDEKEHYNHILGKSHANRTITKENFSTIRKVQKSILSVAKRHNVPIIENNDLTDTLNKITVLLGIDLLPHVIS